MKELTVNTKHYLILYLQNMTEKGIINLIPFSIKVESPSLTFGSAVDCLLTGTKQEFEDTFIISDIPKVEEGVLKVLDVLYNTAIDKTKPLYKVPDKEILDAVNSVNYQARWGMIQK